MTKSCSILKKYALQLKTRRLTHPKLIGCTNTTTNVVLVNFACAKVGPNPFLPPSVSYTNTNCTLPWCPGQYHSQLFLSSQVPS